MGAKRLRKQYEKPLKLWDKQRIEAESKLREEYGLKNARELWKMQTLLRRVRREARRLLAARGKDVERRKEQLVKRLKRFLLRKEAPTLDDVLSLTIRDVLERRLQTLVHKKHLAKTMRQSRQLIAHGHISVESRKISSPSYLVPFDEEDNINWFGHALKLDAQPKAAEAPVSAGVAEAAEVKAVA